MAWGRAMRRVMSKDRLISRKPASDIIVGKTFDNGLLCSSPNSVVVDAGIAEELKRECVSQGAYFLNPAEIDAVTKVLVSPQRLPNPALVGRPATVHCRESRHQRPGRNARADCPARRSRARLSALD